MSFLALHSLARLQDVVGRRAGSEDLSEEQGRDVGKAIRNLCAMALYAELQQPVVPKELILQICKWCSHKTQSQFLCFLRHGMRRMADLGLELAPLKVILHRNEKNGTWWEEDLRTSVQAAVESGKSLDTLRLRLRSGNLLPLTNLESEWITWRDFPASLMNITKSFEDCAEDPVRDLEEALPWDLQGWVRQFRAQQEGLLAQRLWKLRESIGSAEAAQSLHHTNDEIIRQLVVLRPRAMLSHNWSPVREWLRWRFHVASEVLTRIFTVAAKIVHQLVKDVDQNIKKVSSVPSQHAHRWTVHDVQLSDEGRASQRPTFVSAVQLHQMSPQVSAVQLHQMSPQVHDVQLSDEGRASQRPTFVQGRRMSSSMMANQVADLAQELKNADTSGAAATNTPKANVGHRRMSGSLMASQEKPKSRPIVRQRWGDLVDGEADSIDVRKYDEALRGEATPSQQLSPAGSQSEGTHPNSS